jgi:hypothetical protein
MTCKTPKVSKIYQKIINKYKLRDLNIQYLTLISGRSLGVLRVILMSFDT